MAGELKCQLLVNGGFYTENNEPTGLFITDGETVEAFRSNTLFNGILSVNEFDTPRITRTVPSGVSRIAVQTGPVVFENGSPVNLSLVRDERSRRTVAMATGFNELVFAIFYEEKSVYKGPLLTDLPELVEAFGKATGLIIADAINLDGGSASTFISQNGKLTEISSVGSFFCLK